MTPFEDFVVCMMGAWTILFVLAAAKWEKSRAVGFVMAAISVVFMIGYVGFAVGRGGPKSVSTETARPAEAQVLWMHPVKNVGIYAVLTWPGLKEPKFYWFPWDDSKGKAAEAALVEAAARHSGISIKNPFGGGRPGQNTSDNSGVASNFDFPARPLPVKP